MAVLNLLPLGVINKFTKPLGTLHQVWLGYNDTLQLLLGYNIPSCTSYISTPGIGEPSRAAAFPVRVLTRSL